MTKEHALLLAETKFWEGMSYREIAEFQMVERLMCMPFTIFHEAMEKTLGRPVYTHEFGLNFQGLLEELFNGQTPPTLEEIIGLLPAEKRIIILSSE